MDSKFKVTITTKDNRTIIVTIIAGFEYEAREFILLTMENYKTIVIEKL